MTVHDKTKLSEDHVFKKYLLVLATPLAASWTAAVHTERHMAVSETSMIKRQFQTETLKTQRVCLVQQIHLFVKCSMVQIRMTTPASEGSVFFWETKTHLQSLQF